MTDNNRIVDQPLDGQAGIRLEAASNSASARRPHIHIEGVPQRWLASAHGDDTFTVAGEIDSANT
jgi:hypothetical protein